MRSLFCWCWSRTTAARFSARASVIACDLDERPRLSPSVAAVSVAPSAGGMVLAQRWWITRRKRALRFALCAYLRARPERTGFTSG